MHAIIGGTGFYDPELFSDAQEIERETPFGTVSLISGVYKSTSFLFLPRHGKNHAIPPSKINFRANILALKDSGVRRIAATSAVGSMRKRLPPESLVLATQFLDFTKVRQTSLFDTVIHKDFTEPYCPALRKAIEGQARRMKMKIFPRATYVCTEGPRFETPAEIQMFSRFGDIVGMTGVPEVVMAREAGMCYASLCIVTNWAAGISKERLYADDYVLMMKEKKKIVLTLLLESLLSVSCKDCRC